LEISVIEKSDILDWFLDSFEANLELLGLVSWKHITIWAAASLQFFLSLSSPAKPN
jgi:hypothetical protein